MGELGDEALARPGLSLDEDGGQPGASGLQLNQPGHLFQDDLHGRALAQGLATQIHGLSAPRWRCWRKLTGVVSPQAHDSPPDVGLGPPASPDAEDGQTEDQPVAVIKSSSSRPGERWWWWCLSTHARSSFIVGVLCLGVVCTQGKFEVVYKDDTPGEEPAARVIDEKMPPRLQASASDGQHHEMLTERGGS